MKKVKVDVIFRKCKNNGDIVAFIPEMDSNFGSIGCYMHIGQHSEASLEWYRNDTIPAKPEEYAELLAELKGIYETDIYEPEPKYELVIKKRINYDKLRKAWHIYRKYYVINFCGGSFRHGYFETYSEACKYAEETAEELNESEFIVEEYDSQEDYEANL